MLCLVLAGGEGGRLGRLTDGRAKPALPFGGVYRLIDFPLSNCHHSRISGTVAVGSDGRVTAFDYKPEQPQSDIVTTEVFVYDAKVLLDTLAELDAEGEEISDFGDSLLPRLVERGKTWSDDLGGYWRDVGTIESYWQAHMDLLEPDSQLRLDDAEWPILTRASQRPPAYISATATIEDSLISPGCTVRGRVAHSVLGPGVVVDQGVEVVDSVVLGAARIRADVRRAIVDEGTDVLHETSGANAPAVVADGD